MQFQQATLENGLTVLAELNPNVHSVAVGFFVKTGARDEVGPESGVSHFLEHMVFKGTESLSAEDVNRIFDELGAKYNASTSEEVTMFYGAVLPEFLPRVFELLAGILYPSLREEDFNVEKKVILEEIGMYQDMPGFTAYDLGMRHHFANHPLGQSILGTNKSITDLSLDQMASYHQRRYLAGNIQLVVTGNTNWEQIVQLASQHCAAWPSGNGARARSEVSPAATVHVLHRPQDTQQHIVHMSVAPPADHPMRMAAELLALIVGDDSGSRMFWEIADPGYAETAELSFNEYEGAGVFMTFLGCGVDEVHDNLCRIRKIMETVNESGVTEEELRQAKNKAQSRIVLRSERPMGRLGTVGANWMYRGKYVTLEEEVAELEKVTVSDIEALLKAYPLAQTTTVAIGPLEELQPWS